jgi:hypothetical protein
MRWRAVPIARVRRGPRRRRSPRAPGRCHLWLFELCNFPHRPGGDPRDDLDLASPAIVKTLEGRLGDTYPNMTWEPKAAFTAIADCYRG